MREQENLNDRFKERCETAYRICYSMTYIYKFIIQNYLRFSLFPLESYKFLLSHNISFVKR